MGPSSQRRHSWGVWKLRTVLERTERDGTTSSSALSEVQEVGARGSPTRGRQLTVWGGWSSFLGDGADAGGAPVPKGGSLRQEGSTEGCECREIRKSHLAQGIPQPENS